MTVTHRNNPWFYAFLIVALGLIATAFVRSCDRRHNDSLPPTPQPEQQRQRITNTDSLESRIEERERFLIDSLTKPIKDRQKSERIIYRYIRIQDEQLEHDYRAGGTAADSVISSKNKRIIKAETLLARCDTLRGQDSLKIASLAGTVKRKTHVGDSLGLGWETANLENAKLQKKLKRRNRLIAIGAGVVAIFAGGVAASR